MNRFRVMAVEYKSLTKAAKAAFNAGDGRHGKYIVDGEYISVAGVDGRAGDWIRVLRKEGT